MATRLVYTDRFHQYALDGKRVPSVTTVTGKATAKKALAPAAAKFTAQWCAENVAYLDESAPGKWIAEAKGAYQKSWRAKAERGTLLHTVAMRVVAGEPLNMADPETGEVYADDVVATSRQLVRFMDDWAVAPLLVERRVFHPEHWWAGTLDLVADLGNGERWLLDYKTGSGVYPEASLQAAAYRHAQFVQVETDDGWQDEPMPEVSGAAVVWAQPDEYQVIPVRSDDVVYQVFRHMLPVAAWADWKPDQCIRPPLPVPVSA